MSRQSAKRARVEPKGTQGGAVFDAVVVTTCHETQCIAIREELARRPAFNDLVALSVADPHSRRVGSGGGTLNALVEAAEALTAKAHGGRRTPIDEALLRKSKICIIHSGGDSQRSPTQSVCGKAWSWLNSVDTSDEAAAGATGSASVSAAASRSSEVVAESTSMPNAPFDILYKKLCAIFAGAPEGGMVVASCDVLLLMEEPPTATYDWDRPGVVGLAIPTEVNLGPNHGCFAFGVEAGNGAPATLPVSQYLQKPSVAELRATGAVIDLGASEEGVAIDTGVLHFDNASTAALLALSDAQPFVNCTKAGTKAFRVELYSDIMLAFGLPGAAESAGQMAARKAAFLAMKPSDADAVASKQGRELLWEALSAMATHAVLPRPGCRFAHLGTTAELMEMLSGHDMALKAEFRLQALARAHVSPPHAVRGATVINSILRGDSAAEAGVGAVVEHSDLHGAWTVEAGALVSGVRLQSSAAGARHAVAAAVAAGLAASASTDASAIGRFRVPSGTVVQETQLDGGLYTSSCFGVHDNIKLHYSKPGATLAGKPWQWLFDVTGTTPDDVWPGVPEEKRNLWSARVFGAYTAGGGGGAGGDAEDEALVEDAWRTGAAPSLWLLRKRAPPADAARAWKALGRVKGGRGRASLQTILARSDASAELHWRAALAERIVAPALGVTPKRRCALITGLTGQDGSYLAEFLLEKGYDVHGVVRRASSFNTGRIERIYSGPHAARLFTHYGDLTDPTALVDLVRAVRPDEVYNLGAQSHVKVSFAVSEDTAAADGVGVLRLLNAIRTVGLEKTCRFYQASTSELYGKVQAVPQSETTPFYPRSPYAVAKQFAYWICVNYREAYGMHTTNGILFNHESPRRGRTFVTRKISVAAAKIGAGVQECVYLGNLDAKRDWGHARDYVEAMWLMLQQPEGDDFVVATGVARSVRDFCEAAFARVGLALAWRGARGTTAEVGYVAADPARVVVRVDPQYYRPTEVDLLLGDPTKAKNKIGWTCKVSFEQLVNEMVDADVAKVSGEAAAAT
eukprot:g1135.t1